MWGSGESICRWHLIFHSEIKSYKNEQHISRCELIPLYEMPWQIIGQIKKRVLETDVCGIVYEVRSKREGSKLLSQEVKRTTNWT